MCKYCEYDINELQFKKINFGALGMGLIQLQLSFDDDENATLSADFSSDGDDRVESAEIRINYCPMCGQKYIQAEEERE